MVPKANVQRLAGMALDLGAAVLRGTVMLEGARYRVGDTYLDTWLEKYSGQQLLLVAAAIDAESDPPKTCGVCGRDYTGEVCPYCREARRRLRGD
jgi:hypothetical protein